MPNAPTAPLAQKTGSGELRTDLPPLLKRFPLLGRPVAAKWMSGTMGDARVPGPSTYWIDAVLQLEADHVAWLRRQYAVKAGTSQAAQNAPGVVAGLRGELPPGPWDHSAELDAALSQQGFVAKVYLSGDRLVLVALGQ